MVASYLVQNEGRLRKLAALLAKVVASKNSILCKAPLRR